MSSNIRIQKKCQHCKSEFTAKTTVTKYCSLQCSRKAYKLRMRNQKIEEAHKETQSTITQEVSLFKTKEYLTVKETSTLLGCSKWTIYRLIESKRLKSFNLGIQKTMIRRIDIDELFQIKKETRLPEDIDIKDCYFVNQILDIYNVSEKALYSMIKRNQIPKIKKGKYTYVPKKEIDNLLS
ncbi:helix-turn-helix domain-containing protein [Wenyingzhuangia sp. IMCC45533]